MTDAPKPPKRRRRKIIVALLLVLVSGVAWWEWPRGDARFVGKWDVVERDRNGKESRFERLTLWADGSARAELQDYPIVRSWRVEDGRLYVETSSAGGLWKWKWFRGAIDYVESVTGHALRPSATVYRIERISSNEIDVVVILSSASDPMKLVARRRPE